MLYLNKKLYLFNKTTSPLCLFCKIDEEIVPHLFSEFPSVERLPKNLENSIHYRFPSPGINTTDLFRSL